MNTLNVHIVLSGHSIRIAKHVRTVDTQEINMHHLSEEQLSHLGYKKISDNGQYGVYANKAGIVVPGYGIMPKHKRHISFNRDGNYVGIKEDAQTRTVFHGVINTEEEFEVILNCVR
jgi:hypothetical protein